jgi:hypothetical protein
MSTPRNHDDDGKKIVPRDDHGKVERRSTSINEPHTAGAIQPEEELRQQLEQKEKSLALNQRMLGQGPTEEGGWEKHEQGWQQDEQDLLHRTDQAGADARANKSGQTRAEKTGEGETPLWGQGVEGSINEPPGSTIGSGIPSQPPTGGESVAPAITALDPDECTIGEESFDMFVTGTGFDENSVIVFAGQDEPTDLEDDGTLSTGINMDVWQGADVVKVSVKNGALTSNEMDFTFHAEAAQRKAPPKAVKRKGKGVKGSAKAKSKSKR